MFLHWFFSSRLSLKYHIRYSNALSELDICKPTNLQLVVIIVYIQVNVSLYTSIKCLCNTWIFDIKHTWYQQHCWKLFYLILNEKRRRSIVIWCVVRQAYLIPYNAKHDNKCIHLQYLIKIMRQILDIFWQFNISTTSLLIKIKSFLWIADQWMFYTYLHFFNWY